MHLLIALACLLLGSLRVESASLKDTQCGYLTEDALLKTTGYSVPTEQQWIARFSYNNDDEKKLPEKGCQGVLISKRNVLAPAHCFVQYEGRTPPHSVELGVWNKSTKANEVSCDQNGYCVLPSQVIPITEIAVHPEYDPLTLKHDLAVLRLDRDAKKSPNVMPICMPPDSLVNNTMVGKFFVTSGLPIREEAKRKAWVNTLSRSFCEREHKSLLSSSTMVCGYLNQKHYLYRGAPLLGVQMKENEPQNYYLAGVLLDTKNIEKSDRYISSFLSLWPYLEFIKRNSESLIIIN